MFRPNNLSKSLQSGEGGRGGGLFSARLSTPSSPMNFSGTEGKSSLSYLLANYLAELLTSKIRFSPPQNLSLEETSSENDSSLILITSKTSNSSSSILISPRESSDDLFPRSYRKLMTRLKTSSDLCQFRHLWIACKDSFLRPPKKKYTKNSDWSLQG